MMALVQRYALLLVLAALAADGAREMKKSEAKEKAKPLTGVLKLCSESKDPKTCNKHKGCHWIDLPKNAACFAENCHLYEKISGRAFEDACHRAPHCIFQKTPEGAKCFIDDCHVYGADTNTARGEKFCRFANHCRYKPADGATPPGCYWKECSWYDPTQMSGNAQKLCAAAPKCKWTGKKCTGATGYARGKVPMDYKEDDDSDLTAPDGDTDSDSDNEPMASSTPGSIPDSKPFHEEEGDGEGEGEGDDEDYETAMKRLAEDGGGEPAPPKTSRPPAGADGDDDADEDEDEDYETAMKKLQEQSGEL